MPKFSWDREQMFEWLQKKAVSLHDTIEKGIEKGTEFKEAVSAKIEASPRAKAARDFSADYLKKQWERLSDTRIKGNRIGDLPHVTQRMLERQFYKLLLKMREIDPEMNWDQFMPNPEEMPVFAAFETLGLPYGTPFEEVKKTYRRLMREYHPDKHSESPEAERQATEKTQELTVAYEIISEHYGK